MNLSRKSKVAVSPYKKSNQSSTEKPFFIWIQCLIRQTRIRQKISLGYTLAVGIAVLGGTTGQLVGGFYSRQAFQKLNHEQEEERLLINLNIAVLNAQSQQQQMITLTNRPQFLQQKHSQLLEQIDKIKVLTSELQTLLAESNDPADAEWAALNKLLQTSSLAVKLYSDQLQVALKQIDTTNLTSEEILATQQLFLDFTQSDAALNFYQLSDDVTKMVKLANQGQDQAENSLKQAISLYQQITIISLFLSIVSAIVLASYTSRAISYPIEEVTKVAQQVTEESNFNLIAPVMTLDEVGVLATSLNCLIQSVAKYTQELELARQTLEKRVEERTEELSQKNQQLQQAHNQLNQTLQNLQKTQAQLIQSEKMSSLGQMVAGIAHEINNPVSFVYSNLEHANNYTQDLIRLVHLYQQQYPNPTPAIQDETEAIDLEFIKDDLPKLLSSMKTGADRISQIVLSLRNFSRLDEAEIKSANLNQGIDSTLLILNHRLNTEIEVIKNYGDLPLVRCYPARLNQVFMNIIVNAIDALEDAKKKYKNFSPSILIQTETVNVNQVKVRILDNGSGIKLEDKNKLFDPFFTTKPVGQGTGLGLAICYQIIEKHKGKIEVISEPGQKTEFAITLPIKQSFS